MSEGRNVGTCEEYVKATQDYSYQRDDRTLHMYKGEIFMLLRRSTPDWWQVIRQCETHAFYAPAQFLQVTVVPHDQMKQYIQQARQHQKQQQQQQSQQFKKDKGQLYFQQQQQGYVQKAGGEEIVVGRRPQVLPYHMGDSVGELASPGPQVPSQVYLTKIEPTLVHTERKEVCPGRHHGFSSFKSDVSKGFPSHSTSSELPVSTGNLQSHESSSSHTSKSSLNDGSAESLKHFHFRKQVMKASSHDELTKGERSQSSLDVSQPKAASSEELDARYATRDFLFKSNQLSHRHRSNSVDFRLFHKELSFTEMKQGSLDKGRKPRISKDPGNRRRSWAVEEIRGCENFRPSLRRGEAVDAAIVLDVPPKLPPKQKKHRMDAFKSSSENLSKLEGPIDLKLQEVKMYKNMQPQATSSLPLTKDVERGHSRHASDPLMLAQDDKKTIGRDWNNQGNSRDHPIALPRKMLPPQVSPLDVRKAAKDTQAGVRIDSLTFGEVSKDANGNQVKKSSSHSSLNTGIATSIEGGFLRRGGSMSQSSYKHKPYPEVLDKSTGTHDIIKKPESNSDILRKPDGTPDSQRKATSTTLPSQSIPEPNKKGQSSTSKSSGGFKEKFSSFKQKGGRKDTERKDEEKENDICKIPPRETPTPDSSRGGKLMPTPPSPQTPPQRIVLEDWGEYVDEATGRPYYYNSRTREKRWKPPRKGIHSISIPEVPTFDKGDEGVGSISRGAPRSPAPDYPTSPTFGSQQPFSYSHLSESSPHPLSYSRSATAIPTCSPTPHPAASSHSLPGTGSSQSKRITPPRHPLIPPAVPPSSAKPSLPVTPTTPEISEAIPSESSALLDVLYNVPVPPGWEKRYDAFLQQVYFFNKHTHERNTMDIAKELQLEANVFHDQYTKEGVAKRISVPSFCEPESPQAERLRHISSDQVTSGGRQVLNQTLSGDTPELEHEISGVKASQGRKIPPQKPPRKTTKTLKPSVSLLTIESQRHPSTGGQTIPLLSHPNTPSILDAGSRVSSFAPRSSFHQRGHTRSKSETVKIQPLDLEEASLDSHLAKTLKETMVITTGTISPKSPCSLSPKSPRSPGPVSPVLPNSNSPTRDTHGNVSILAKSLRLQVPGGPRDNDTWKNKKSVKDANLLTRPTITEDSTEAVSAPPEVLARQTQLFKELNFQLKPETSTRQTSTNHGSTMEQTDNRKILGNVRKSTFISQDEVGSILEDKSLASIPRLIRPADLGDLSDPVSPLFKRFLDWDDPGSSDSTPSWTFTSPDRKWQDIDKTVLEETDDPDSRCDSLNRPTSPPENVRISRLAECLSELKEYTEKEGFVQRTFLMREGKKVRKNWTSSYVRFINREFDSGATGILYFSKSRDDEKKPDFFEMYPRCQLEYASDRKTSRTLVLGLRNARDTEVLMQFEDKEIVHEWQRFLEMQEGIDYTPPEKEEKKGKRGSDKLKRAASVEQLSPDSKGITDKLRNFIKRRPPKETLEKKGIYRESVFGSTLAELHQQDKTAIPIFVLQCINHIEKSDENLQTDGLYRISGNAAQIQKIRFEVAQRNYTILSQEKEIHNLSGSLKLFFRELKEPLIPYDIYNDFIQATGSEFRRKNQQVEKLNKAVNKLPSENYDTLRVLLQHLLRVNEFEAENRMSLSNLAIVFGPCLLWPRETNSHDLMTDVMLHNRVIEGLLSDYAKIFTSRR
ncbi:hypothetical protein Pmani_009092 [Petrolisthes manimaculis]|uniref:Rho GTPase-activating protein 12 n=1 Tax=Petrolisthes manimaculis TaxID=1843537 RepID=A0AAE1Q4Z7_9EUCA|nr:hypothetical protein Pmani_009092 [Petrolisthes manimaculis]